MQEFPILDLERANLFPSPVTVGWLINFGNVCWYDTSAFATGFAHIIVDGDGDGDAISRNRNLHMTISETWSWLIMVAHLQMPMMNDE